MEMRDLLFTGVISAALSLGAAPMSQAAEMGDVDEPIKLAVNEWTGQHISTHVAGELLKKLGYEVEYVTAGYYPQMTALQDNTVSATLEIWSSNIGEHYDNAIATGNVVELGDLGLTPVETWFYTPVSEEKCPGLPDYQALKDCAQVFASAETFPDGRLLDYPADWGTSNVDRLKAFGLPIKSLPAGSEGALVSEIKSANVRNEPLLVMFWAPHWVHAVVELKPVTLPAYEDGCYEDASVGVNPDATWDCDWQRGYIKKMAWVGLKDKWPAAHALLTAYTLRNEDQIPMMNAIDQDGKDLGETVSAWVDANQAIWQPWIDAAKQ